MELLRDVYWEPDHDELKTRAWTGIYSDGGTGATSFKNCPGAVSSVDGNLLSENMGDGADDGGTCPISERCTILFESYWEWTKQCWGDDCDTWRTGAILRSEALQDRACGTGRQPLPPFSSVTQKYKKITRKRYHGYEAHVCLCENTAPAASYDPDALELTSPGLAKGEGRTRPGMRPDAHLGEGRETPPRQAAVAGRHRRHRLRVDRGLSTHRRLLYI